VDQVQVDVVEAEPLEALGQRPRRALGALAVVPQLGRDEDLVARQARGRQPLPHTGLVAVDRGGVDVAVARLECEPDGLLGLTVRDLEDAVAQLRDRDVAAEVDGGDGAHALTLGKS
jgi:hypothetical protein